MMQKVSLLLLTDAIQCMHLAENIRFHGFCSSVTWSIDTLQCASSAKIEQCITAEFHVHAWSRGSSSIKTQYFVGRLGPAHGERELAVIAYQPYDQADVVSDGTAE